MPEITKEDFQTLENFQRLVWFGRYDANREFVKVTIGRFLAGISGELSKPTKKALIYSAHDSTIAPLLGALNLKEKRWPAFGSNIIFGKEIFNLLLDYLREEIYLKKKEDSLSFYFQI